MLFVQVVGMLSAEGLITMQRVTLDGTKIKANASGNTFRRKEKIEAHLALAREASTEDERTGRGGRESGQTPSGCETPRGAATGQPPGSGAS